MSTIKVHDKEFKLYIDENTIINRVNEIGKQLSAELKGEDPLFLSILNGSFMFTGDLMKVVDIDCEISFVKLASYRGTKSTGNVMTMIGLDTDIEDRCIVILEDIIDTGKTMNEFIASLNKHHPSKIIVVTLLSKPDALEHNVKIDHSGFEIPNDFIVGYGLDYDGHGRNYKEIYQLVE